MAHRGGSGNPQTSLNVNADQGIFAPIALNAPQQLFLGGNPGKWEVNVGGLIYAGGVLLGRTLTGVAEIDSAVPSGGSAPTVIVNTNAGTGATASVVGNDLAGVITVNSGSAALVTGAQVALTFNKVKSAAPSVVMLTTQGSGSPRTIVVTTALATTGFSVSAAALTASSAYQWAYLVIQ